MVTMDKHTRGSAGFTLTEMLVALLVLMLFGALAIAVINVATSVREDSTFVSDSDVLAGTINTALADCIHYKESTNDNREIVTLHGKTIVGATLDIDTDHHLIVKGEYGDSQIEERLLNAGAYGNLKISTIGTTSFSGDVQYTIVGNKPSQTKHVKVSYASLKTN